MTIHRCATCARTFAALLVVDVRQGESARVERWCLECLRGFAKLGGLHLALSSSTALPTSRDGDAVG